MTCAAIYRTAGLRVPTLAQLAGALTEGVVHAVIDDGRLLRVYAHAAGRAGSTTSRPVASTGARCSTRRPQGNPDPDGRGRDHARHGAAGAVAMREITHRLKKRSFWDGSVTAMCGQTYQPGYYRESWFSLGPINCPQCLAAQNRK